MSYDSAKKRMEQAEHKADKLRLEAKSASMQAETAQNVERIHQEVLREAESRAETSIKMGGDGQEGVECPAKSCRRGYSDS